MHAQWRLGLLAGLAVCLSGTARAQEPIMFNPVMLLHTDSVREELKVTKEQQPKVKEELDRIAEQFKEDRDKMRGMSAQERQSYARKKHEESLKNLGKVLDADQVKRLKQIHLQVLLLGAFRQDEVARALKLTDEQKKSLDALEKDLQNRVREIFLGEGDFQEKQQKMTAARKEARDKFVAGLTAEQKKTWKALTGEPFDIKLNPQ